MTPAQAARNLADLLEIAARHAPSPPELEADIAAAWDALLVLRWKPIESLPKNSEFIACSLDCDKNDNLMFDGLAWLSGPVKFEDGNVRFYNLNSHNYTDMHHWKFWQPPLPVPVREGGGV